MNIVFDAVLVFLASAGILFILWTLTGLLFPERSVRSGRLFAVYVASAGDQGVQEAARAVAWISETYRCPIGFLVADAGLSPAERREAELYCESRGIGLCRSGELQELLFRGPEVEKNASVPTGSRDRAAVE